MSIQVERGMTDSSTGQQDNAEIATFRVGGKKDTFCKVTLLAREPGGVSIPVGIRAFSSNGSSAIGQDAVKPRGPFPARTDLTVVAETNKDGTALAAGMDVTLTAI